MHVHVVSAYSMDLYQKPQRRLDDKQNVDPTVL
jgi:hypothetical protein